MKSEVLDKLRQLYGERATDSLLECRLYSRDLAPVPNILTDPLFKNTPDMVVAPVDAREVAQTLRLAWEEGIPVTPRAGASTVYFNTVPARGGLVMDLNRLTGIEAIDPQTMTVKVQAGTTWKQLDDTLQPHGYAACSVPSSAPAASVGGWFSMMGYGIGSIKYGSLLSQIRSIVVVLPDGSLRTLTPDTDPPLQWFAAAEGTLGIVTSLTLKIRKANQMSHYVFKVPDVPTMSQLLQFLQDSEPGPYNLHYGDSFFNEGMYQLGLVPEELKGSCTVGVDYEGSDPELQQAEAGVQEAVNHFKGVKLLAQELAQQEWDQRYKALQLKRGGPSQLGGELLMPLTGLAGYLKLVENLANSYNITMMSYGEVVTPDQVTVMTMFYADESKTFDYIIDLSLVKKIQDAGYRMGGCPYGIGLWNSPYVNRVYSPEELKELKRRKKLLDPRGIMNPAKVYGPPFIMNSFNFAIGMGAMAGWRRLFRGGGR
ncbi:FAD-binding oxidoreductase [Syntrophomonas erecta]